MKIKFLFLVLLLCLTFTTSCEFSSEDEEVVQVEEKMEAVKQLNNYEMEMEITMTDETSRMELNIAFAGDVKEVTIKESGIGYSFYIETVDKDSEVEEYVNYIIFNPSLMGSTPTYNGYVRLSIDELKEEVGVKEDTVEKDNPLLQLINIYDKLVGFFSNPQNEHYDLDDDSNYVLNQKGKEAFREVVAEINSGSQEVQLDCEVIIESNDDYITDINITANPVDDPDEKLFVEISFDDFNDVKINLPTDTITFDEFKKYLEGSTSILPQY